MTDTNIEILGMAIQDLHGCDSKWLAAVPVTEIRESRVVWAGNVHIFELRHHPKATKCYAWSAPIEGDLRRRVYAVLHAPPIDSPEAAVHVALMLGLKTTKSADEGKSGT